MVVGLYDARELLLKSPAADRPCESLRSAADEGNDHERQEADIARTVDRIEPVLVAERGVDAAGEGVQIIRWALELDEQEIPADAA